ncbi:MAG: hypothetical protein ACKVQA_23910 [Burkholderiales bacterium]
MHIPAGQLAQIGVGAELIVVPGPLAPPESNLGIVRVKQSDPFTSLLDVAPGSTLKVADFKGTYARLFRPAVQIKLRIGGPASDAKKPLPTHVTQALRLLRARPDRFVWVGKNEPADVILHLEDEQIWQVPAAGGLVKFGPYKSPSISITRDAQELSMLLGENLSRIAKALSLIQISNQFPPESEKRGLEVKLTRSQSADNPERTFSGAALDKVTDGMHIRFKIKNRTSVPVDVTLLYVDSAFGITPLFPTQGELNRIMPNNALDSGAPGQSNIKINASTLGIERLIVIAAPAGAQSEPANYSDLAQPRINRTRSVSNDDSVLTELLELAAFGGSTNRGGVRAPKPLAGYMQVFTWEVIKR